MTETTTSKDRRAQVAALVGFVLQLALFVLLLVFGLQYESDAMLAASRWMLGGAPIWLVLALVYWQRKRTSDEKLEAEELLHERQAQGSEAIFDTEDESYLIEKRRLNWILRWVLPTTTLLMAAYHIAGTFMFWGWSLSAPLKDTEWAITGGGGEAMAIVAFVGFVAFLFACYTVGMSRVRGWRMIRSGASYLAGNVLSCALVLVSIALERWDVWWAEPVASYAIRIAMLVLGIEFVVNYVLDVYRPRQPGQEIRPSFDSRLLGLVSEPTGIARSIAEAINYQFGFEVSGTWFYQLLKRAMLPMLVFGLLVLFALSSVVIVDADEQAFVERFGVRLQPVDQPLGPGLAFKAPWPIDKVYRARVGQVRLLSVGNAPSEQETEVINGVERPKPILWGSEHKFNTEMMLVVGSKNATDLSSGAESTSGDTDSGKAVAVGLLMVSVDIQYIVSDLDEYLYKYTDPEGMVDAIAYQVLSDYAAGVDVERFLGEGRSGVNEELARLLQEQIDEEDLGINVLFVGLQEAHPTDDVAKKYHEVVAAEREKKDYVERADGMAEQILTAATGSADRARELDAAIEKMDEVSQNPDSTPEEIEEARHRVSVLLEGDIAENVLPAGGGAAKLIAKAQGKAQQSITEAEAKRRLFESELVAFQSAPELYKVRKYLAMLRVALKDVRKYVLAVDPELNVIVEYDKKEKGTIELGEAPKR